jgi:pyruvate formate lyase activating enzyme
MNACIFDIKRFAVHDGPGIRVTIFFKGCPMQCIWCHNPEGINDNIESFSEDKMFDGINISEQLVAGRMISLEELLAEIEKDRIFMEESGGGVTLSGGEPVLQHEFVRILLKELKKLGIHSCIDTSGYVPENIMASIAKKADLFLYDLKLMDDRQHINFTGVSNKLVLGNLKVLDNLGAEIIIRFPLIPGINDNPEHLNQVITFLKRFDRIRNVDVLPFHKFARSKYRRFCRPFLSDTIRIPSSEEVMAVRSVFQASGFNSMDNIG